MLLTLEKALNIAYRDDLDVDAICIEPIDAAIWTDEESGY